MAEVTKLRISELDFDQIKNNFKSYLKEQDIFRDYNLEGSNISMLLDILAYNTHYNAFYLNMIANEMFIDSATTRNAMISLSKLLGYVPKSRTAAKANVNIAITPNDAPANITIAKNTKFSYEQFKIHISELRINRNFILTNYALSYYRVRINS